MERIGQRIERLRKAKGWSRPQLAREMAKASGADLSTEAIRTLAESIRQYETGLAELPRERRAALARSLGRDERYIEFGDEPQRTALHEPRPKYEVAGSSREELVLYLFRALFPLQQLRLVQGLRAAMDSNNLTRKFLGNKPLVGVSDEAVRKAFGDAPWHELQKGAKKKPRRDFGTALDDFLGDE